jgi:hypothetical protein
LGVLGIGDANAAEERTPRRVEIVAARRDDAGARPRAPMRDEWEKIVVGHVFAMGSDGCRAIPRYGFRKVER